MSHTQSFSITPDLGRFSSALCHAPVPRATYHVVRYTENSFHGWELNLPFLLKPSIDDARRTGSFQGTQEQWNNVWYVCTAFFAVGALVYALFASGELQPWAVAPAGGSSVAGGKRGVTNAAMSPDDDQSTKF